MPNPPKKKPAVGLQGKMNKFRQALKKWDDTDEGRVLCSIICSNLQAIDESWHLVRDEKDLEILRANKMALSMLRNCFETIRYEVNEAEKQLRDNEEFPNFLKDSTLEDEE